MVYLFVWLGLLVGHHEVVHRFLMFGVFGSYHGLRADLLIGVDHVMLGLVHCLDGAQANIAHG